MRGSVQMSLRGTSLLGRRAEPFEHEVRRPADKVASARGRDVPMRNGKSHVACSNDDTSINSSPLKWRDTLECDMKRLLLSAAIIAMAGPAWGQVQADHTRICYISALDENGDGAVCDPSFESDIVLVTSERIGYTRTDRLTCLLYTSPSPRD